MKGDGEAARRVLRLRHGQPAASITPPADTLPRAGAARVPDGAAPKAPGWAAPPRGAPGLPAVRGEESPLPQTPWAADGPGETDAAGALLDQLRRQRRRTSQVQDFWEELT